MGTTAINLCGSCNKEKSGDTCTCSLDAQVRRLHAEVKALKIRVKELVLQRDLAWDAQVASAQSAQVWSGKVERLTGEVKRAKIHTKRDLDVLKIAYRKHHLNDDSIGWDELGNHLCDRICEHIGDDKFAIWLKGISR